MHVWPLLFCGESGVLGISELESLRARLGIASSPCRIQHAPKRPKIKKSPPPSPSPGPLEEGNRNGTRIASLKSFSHLFCNFPFFVFFGGWTGEGIIHYFGNLEDFRSGGNLCPVRGWGNPKARHECSEVVQPNRNIASAPSYTMSQNRSQTAKWRLAKYSSLACHCCSFCLLVRIEYTGNSHDIFGEKFVRAFGK